MVRAVSDGSSEESRSRLAAIGTPAPGAVAFRVMSRAMTEAPTIPSAGYSIGETVSETSIRAPSLRIRSVS